MDDWQLIQEYVERKSESAFRILVERYTNLVYSAALRQARESQLAEEIAQTVFILFAQKADGFRRDVILPGWLFRTTHFVANRAIRTEKRRQRRDMEAYQMQQLETSDADWLRMAPCLDEALAQLGETERNAIILRYFQGKELRQVGVALGMSEEAARKRITRSVEKLRSFFAERGYSISAALIVAALGTQSVKAAPAGLAGTFAATALSSGVAAGAFPLVLQVLNAWRWSKLKAFGVGAAGSMAIVALLFFAISQTRVALESEQPEAADIEQTVAARQVEESVGQSAALNQAAVIPNNDPVLRFRVVADDNSEAVGNATLLVRRWSGNSIRTDTNLTTDVSGFCNILHTTTLGRLDVGVLSPGWGARFVTWVPSRKDPIPAEYTLRVERLTNSVGGFLVDANGSPVPEADVFISFRGTGDSFGRESERERVGFVGSAVSVGKSDANGRWTAMVIPTKHEGFQLEATHPHFATTAIASSGAEISSEERQKETLSKLWAGTLVTKMQTSFRLSGRVVGEAGEPIAGAKVSQGTQQKIYRTDASGWFEVFNLERGEWDFTISAEGFAPIRHMADIHEKMQPLEIQLIAGAVLRVRTLDEDGTPVAGVTVGLQQWGEHRHALDWKATSDSGGRIEWRSAPRDEMLELYAKKEGYCYTRDLLMEADSEEHIIKMRRSLTLQVRAVDAKTGGPIQQFKAYPGYGDDQYAWERLHTVHAQNGVAEITFEENELPWRVRVEAQDYVTGTSESFSTNLSAIFDIKMVPLDDIESVQGVILDSSGGVVVNADVALCTIEQTIGARLAKHGLHKEELSLMQKSDTDGYFKFKANPSAHTVVAAHRSGFARVRLPKDIVPLQIVLQPWGRIEGVVHLQEPVNGLSVRLSDWASSQYRGGLYIDSLTFSAVVGADGRFVIESAPPGNLYLSLHHGNGTAPTHETGITVEAGQTAFVEMGGVESDVVGILLPANGVSITNWQKQTIAHLQPASRNAIDKPSGLIGDAVKFWEVDFWQSQRGFLRLLSGQPISLLVQPDGSFRGYNVSSGTYRLSVRATLCGPPSETIASLYEHVVILEQAEGGSRIVFDLGERVLKPASNKR